METRDKRITLPHLAGFFEGEGTVYCGIGRQKKNKYYSCYIMIFITNTCKEKLEHISEEWGGHIRPMKTLEGRKQLYRIEWWGDKAEKILRELLQDPGLYIKRRQAEVALKFRELQQDSVGRVGYSQEQINQLFRLKMEMNHLNKRGVLAVAETKPQTL